MRKITKIGKTVAGSALLVGATLAAGAGLATAQSGSSGDLGDYPQPFVDEDGNVNTAIVVGESAKTADVVGAIEVAGSLGNAAFEETEQTVEGSGVAGTWSASDGVTLDTRNDQLFFDDTLDQVRDTLTEDQLDSLEEVTFQDESGDETDIEFFLYPGNQNMQYGKPDDRDDQDPVHYVQNPESVDDSSGNSLYRLQANFEDELEMNSSDVEDEEIELFGREYTVGTETTGSELVLYGSQQEVDVDAGQSTTITVDGTEHTIELVGVTESDEAVFRLNGNRYSKQEDQTVALGDTELRVSEVSNFGEGGPSDNVEFAVGSEELRLTEEAAIEDEDGDDIDGTWVDFNGDGTDSDPVSQVSSIDVYVGSNDDDMEYVMAGESYSHPTFENYVFRFGGLNPNAAEGGDAVANVEFTTDSDDTVTVSYPERGGESTTIDFIHDDDTSTGPDAQLRDGDDEVIHVYEAAAVQEDEYFLSDAGDFAHMWEVTNIDRDDSSSPSSGDEATVDLQDEAGDQVEVDLDWESEGTNVYEGQEVIDGQTYHFELQDTASDPNLYVAWGDNADHDGGSGVYGVNDLDVGDDTTVYPALDGQNGVSVALHDQVTVPATNNTATEVVLPSTESTDERYVQITPDPTDSTSGSFVTGSSSGVSVDADDGTEANVTVNGGLSYTLVEGTNQTTVNAIDSSESEVQSPAGVVLEPEDDADEEHGYVVTNSYDSNDEELDINDADYSGTTRQTAELESDDDVTAAVDFFGTYTEYDSDEQGTFELWVPNGQAVEGAAFTEQTGDLSAGGGGSSSVTTMEPTGWPSSGMLDSDVGSQERQNSNMILVGGPAVNTLVSDLADADKTWATGDYSQGEAIVQLVEDAFSQGNDALVVAGHSADDTVRASNYIANYEENSGELAGQSQVTLTTGQTTQ